MRLLSPWLILFGLGAYHGINPAMGWLFAVALGLQEKSRRAVLKALPPIALGHALSIGIVAGVLWLGRASLPERPLHYAAGAILLAFALYRLIRSRHPKWVGMRVGFRDLTLWSFLMATSHGAGLMLVPVLLAWRLPDAARLAATANLKSHTGHFALTQLPNSLSTFQWAAAVTVHTLGYLLVALLVALVVYEKLGVAVLRRAWFNLDLVWVFALMLSAVWVVLI
jgi:hypothetical protein